MSDEEKKEEGVLLSFRESKEIGLGGQHVVLLTLVATIKDQELWKIVEKKFIDGFFIHRSEDMKSQMFEAIRSEVLLLEVREKVLQSELEKRTREVALLEEKLAEARQPMEELGRRLSGKV